MRCTFIPQLNSDTDNDLGDRLLYNRVTPDRGRIFNKIGKYSGLMADNKDDDDGDDYDGQYDAIESGDRLQGRRGHQVGEFENDLGPEAERQLNVARASRRLKYKRATQNAPGYRPKKLVGYPPMSSRSRSRSRSWSTSRKATGSAFPSTTPDDDYDEDNNNNNEKENTAPSLRRSSRRLHSRASGFNGTKHGNKDPDHDNDNDNDNDAEEEQGDETYIPPKHIRDQAEMAAHLAGSEATQQQQIDIAGPAEASAVALALWMIGGLGVCSAGVFGAEASQ